MADIKIVRELLAARYPSTEYALLEEVRNGAGFEASNSADFITVSYWPSRGLEMTGFEMKASRSDWTRELKNAKKAEAFFQYCNYFYLLTTNEKVAYMEEIPTTWGWYHVNEKNKLVCLKQAPEIKNQVPWDRSFVVAMLKRAADRSGFVHQSAIETKLKERYQAGIDSAKQAMKRADEDLNRLKEYVKRFEDASGLNLQIHEWGWSSETTKIGEAVKFIMKHGTGDKLERELLRLGETAKQICAGIEEGLKAMEQLKQTP